MKGPNNKQSASVLRECGMGKLPQLGEEWGSKGLQPGTLLFSYTLERRKRPPF